MAQFEELLKRRRSVRSYQDKAVPTDLIKELIRESTMAPSSGNGQPWRFVIVNDRAKMKRISDESKKNLLAWIAADPEAPSKNYEGVLKNPGFNVFYDAPCLVILAGPKGYRSLQVDLALCASYFMLAAADRGLGTCWINLGSDVRDPALRAELGLTGGLAIVAPIIVGHPRAVPTAPPRNAPEILKVIE
ncbi:MAG TPA: nitroreductase family protein [bacterium]|nr:nitroreductase family protein [bacterium]